MQPHYYRTQRRKKNHGQNRAKMPRETRDSRREYAQIANITAITPMRKTITKSQLFRNPGVHLVRLKEWPQPRRLLSGIRRGAERKGSNAGYRDSAYVSGPVSAGGHSHDSWPVSGRRLRALELQSQPRAGTVCFRFPANRAEKPHRFSTSLAATLT